MSSTHSELEAFVEKEGREYQKLLLQAHLELRAARERAVDVLGADRVPRKHSRSSARALMTVVGQVEVPRLAYQAPEVASLHPMDAALSLPDELYSHSVRRHVAEEAAVRSFDEVVEHLSRTTGAPVPKRQVEELAARAADLVNNRRILHYDRALADGLPIGTGVIEGACRYLVKDRMERTGARWSLRGAEAVLRLRSLRASGDFDAYWAFHLEQDRMVPPDWSEP